MHQLLGAEEAFHLNDPGLEAIVDYQKYGDFRNRGTPDYQYVIRDREGLARAVGEGVYPNVTGLLKDPAFQKMQYEKKLEGNVWDFVGTDSPQIGFYKWASNHDEPGGLKQFYAAMQLENAGLYAQAIKAYYAVVVHFPKVYANTSWKTPWYVGPTALDHVAYLIRKHPELGMQLRGGRIRIRNRFDDDPRNDIFEIDPGKIVPAPVNRTPPSRLNLKSLPIQQRLGHGKVSLVQYANGHWQLMVDNAPYVIRGITYSVTPVGKTPDDGSWVVHRDWMLSDLNKNGKIDGPYDSWVGQYNQGTLVSQGPVVGDFQLLKDMGVNTVRLYHHGYNKKLLQDLYQHYGIRVIMGDFLGAYTIGSEAEWNTGTDYRNPDQQKKMLESVRQMVEEYKDEPYILFWVLGNENNYGNANNSREVPDVYYAFLNKAAKLIKSIDSNHPVALSNGDLLFIDKAAKLCPEVDIFGANSYRGYHGVGDSFWRDVKDEWGKPILISEFGCPAYHRHKSQQEAEKLQADYLRGNWEDIERNLAGGPGEGNAIGGVLFEWMDEWWKAGSPPTFDPGVHDTIGQFAGPFPDGWSYEEWYGIVSQGDGKNSPFERQLRQAYFLFKDELWNPKEWKKRGLPQ
jgi:beta-glucuronidase